MAEGSKGIIGSVAVHLGIAAVLVGASWYASHESGTPTKAQDILLVNLDGVPGRKAGLIGEKEGVARGHESGTQTGIKAVHIKTLDVEKIKQQDREAQAQANAEHSNAKSDNTSKSTKNSNTGSATNRTTFSDFQSKQKGGAGHTTGSVGSIGTISVKKGRNYGDGNNGGANGSATEMQIYAGTVTARFKSAWADIVASDGAASAASCGVIVKVDASGTVTFASWINRPKDPHVAELVKRACSQIGNCGPPPGRTAFEIEFPNVGVSEG
ncbi:MAG: hypothetical protein EBR62_00255 [Verrucomicrobia bacterium]|jgi:hypothetical protein|nr:hypothetical protein [Verrucomicrobiota bacterium]